MKLDFVTKTLLSLVSIFLVFKGFNQTPSFIRTWDLKSPVGDISSIPALQVRDVQMSTQYLDGMGRTLQEVVKQGSLQTGEVATDMVKPYVYDIYGRQATSYSSYAESSSSDGSFKTSPITSHNNFMSTQYGSQGETWFYNKTEFDSSPENEISKQLAAGNSWAGSGRGVEIKSWVNKGLDDVRIWDVVNNSNGFANYSSSSSYPEGRLTKLVTVDENGKQVIEFRDKNDLIILKKVQFTATADNGNGANHDNWLCTYFIYDDFNNLRCVLQPEGVKAISPTWIMTSDIQNNQCFQYQYDGLSRLIKKKLPGLQPIYLVYDVRNRLVMSQDGIMRANSQWMYLTYDQLNRPTSTGIIIDANSHENHLAGADSSNSYPTLSNPDELTRTFYEDYLWLPNYGSPLPSTYTSGYDQYFETVNTSWPYAQSNAKFDITRGQITGTRTKVLGTSNYLYSVNIYNEKGNPIQVYNTNITGGTDIVTTQYTWTGQSHVTIQKQLKQGTPSQETVIVTKISYDDLGRARTTENKISNSNVNSGSMSLYKVISENEFDKLGQLKKKRLGPTSPSTQLESLNYEYNIRGWLLGMNRDYTKDLHNNNYFGFDLGYDKVNNGLVNGQSYTNAQYNGNIEGTVWKSRGDGQIRKYDFVYDAVNRITTANFTQYTSGSFSQSAGFNFNMILGDAYKSPYDFNGNILQMQHFGWMITGSGQIDNMRYTYSGSNALKSVTDFSNNPVSKTGDFITQANHPQNSQKQALTASSSQSQFEAITDYTYDENGNLNLDNNKGITSIVYNYLNLPASITIAGKGTITYHYDASGLKHKKTTVDISVPNKTITTITTYISGLVYETRTYSPSDPNTIDQIDELQFVPHVEGRIRFVKAVAGNCVSQPNRLVYDYYIKDHVGNVRAVLTEQQENICYVPASVENSTWQSEQRIYDIVDARRIDKSNTGATQSSFGNKLYQTHGGLSNQKTGLGATLKVMAGDQISIVCESYYNLGSGSIQDMGAPTLVDLFSAFVNSTAAGSHGGLISSDIQSIGTNASQIPGWMSGRSLSSGNAKAFLNWILLDEQFKFVAGGADEVQNGGGYKLHTQFINNPVSVTKNGFLYIYVSNESNLPVYFDNLGITHTPGAIMEETHYYPFGLTMSGISSKALAFGNPSNKQRYNGKEQQSGEFSDGSGLEAYDYGARVYDAQISRWWQPDPLAEKYFSVSPYNYCLNNPISLFDYDGRDAIITIDWENRKITISSTFYVEGGSENDRNEYISAIDAFMSDKNNAKLFSGDFKDSDGNNWSMSIALKYEPLGTRDRSKIGEGNNILNLDHLGEETSSNAGGGLIPIKDPLTGKPTGEFEPLRSAGTVAALRKDSKTHKGLIAIHESFHLLGLTDRYYRGSYISYEGFGTDIMGAAMGRKQGMNGSDIPPTMNQKHWNNWGNFIINPPQMQQQQNQSRGQFILKYRVDIDGGKNSKPF